MTRLAILKLSLGLLLVAGVSYWGLSWAGISQDKIQVGLSSLLMLGFAFWVMGYVRRVLSGQMALHEQQQQFEKAALQEKLQTLTPEALAELARELESEM
ncbi:MAG: DUF3007 family protein [Synechococcaceae cyanobacterium SM2_3_1]|nr:DUF3007 family protein [Synechococcaceae cyanobacterium SM2_3_1]